MGRYIRIFLLNAQQALEYRSVSLVYLLITAVNAGMYLLFWHGALITAPANASGWNLSAAVSYYLLMVILGAFLHVHVQGEVAFEDIQKGNMVRYLTRPLSYFKFKFFEELPWRVIQGVFGAGIMALVLLVYKDIPLVSGAGRILLSACIVLAGYVLCFIYKMMVGLIGFWFTDAFGFLNVEAITFLLLSGFVIPLHLLPAGVQGILLDQPLAYMIYYPIMAVSGLLDTSALVTVLSYQFMWLVLFLVAYKFLWSAGIKRFTGVGQ